MGNDSIPHTSRLSLQICKSCLICPKQSQEETTVFNAPQNLDTNTHGYCWVKKKKIEEEEKKETLLRTTTCGYHLKKVTNSVPLNTKKTNQKHVKYHHFTTTVTYYGLKMCLVNYIAFDRRRPK